MQNAQDEQGKNECREFLTEIAFRRLQLLEDTSDAIDRKAGILLGFVSLVTMFALQLGTPDISSPLEVIFTLSAFAVLFASLVVLIVCLKPDDRRLDPDASKLLQSHWQSTIQHAREDVAASLGQAWEFNSIAHARKARQFSWAVWLAVIGMGLLAFNILIVRAVL